MQIIHILTFMAQLDNVLFYKNMYILRIQLHCLSSVQSLLKYISSKIVLKTKTIIPISFEDSTKTQYTIWLANVNSWFLDRKMSENNKSHTICIKLNKGKLKK